METSIRSDESSQLESSQLLEAIYGGAGAEPLKNFDDILKRTDQLLENLKKGKVPTQWVGIDEADERSSRLLRIALLWRFDLAALSIATGLDSGQAKLELERQLEENRLAECPGEPGIYIWRGRAFAPYVAQWGVALDAVRGEWKGDADKIREFRKIHENLAAHFEKLAEKKSLWLPVWLFHLCVTDPVKAIERLEAALDDCLPREDEATSGATPAVHPDARDGIALSQALTLLGAVKKQRGFLPAAQKSKFFVQRARVDAWSKWSHDWYCTQRYIPRPRIHEWFDELREPTSKSRLLVLHAPGGSGKTMSLRWLITHHCLPRKELVAHLDFDDYIGGAPVRDWQLLLRCAEQINQQLPERDFDLRIEELLSYERGESLADSGKGRPKRELPTASEVPAIRAFPEACGNALKSFSGRIVTIIVDTMEEAMLRSVTGVTDFVATLLRLAQSADNVRIILCGRYPLSHLGFDQQLQQSHPAEWSYYKEWAIQRRLPQFDEQETGNYLRRRGLKLDAAQLGQLYEACAEPVENGPPGEKECSPFDLSLIASLYEKGKGKGEIERLISVAPEARRTHLMERVIDHIEDPSLRWAVRYGAVPRLLTKDFFDEVIIPRLREVYFGQSEQDDPRKDHLPFHLEGREFFSHHGELLKEEDIPGLWTKLTNFAAPGSWIEASGNDLRFQPRVRQAMTELLHQNPVLHSIHQRAAGYFESKAKEKAKEKSPGSAHAEIEALRQEFYHRFQWEPLPAARRLVKVMDDLLANEKFEAVCRLAADVFREGSPSLPPAKTGQIRRAHVLASLDMVDTAPSSERGTWLGEAERALQALRLLYQDASKKPPEITLLAKMLELRGEKGSDDLLGIVRTLRESGSSEPMFKSRVKRGIAMAYEAAGSGECTQLYALLVEERLAGNRVPFSPLSAFLIRCLATTVRSFGGDAACWELLGRIKRDLTGERGRDMTDALHAELLAAFAYLLEGYRRPESSRRLIESASRPDNRTPQLELLRATGPARDFPERGESAYHDLTTRFEGTASADQLATALLCEAWTHAVRCDANACDEAIHRTILHLASTAPVLAGRCHLVKAEYHLFQFHDYAGARQALSDYQRAGLADENPTTANGLRMRLLRGELEYRSQGTTVPGGEARELLEAARRTSRWANRLKASLGLLTLLEASVLEKLAGEIATLIVSGFKQIPDALGRSYLLDVLRDRRDPFLQFPEEHRRQLIEMLAMKEKEPDPFGDPTDASDSAWASLAHANFLRLLGVDHLAWDLAVNAERHFKKIGSLVGLREAWHLQALAGWKYPSELALQPYLEQRAEWGRLPDVIAVEQAGLCLAAGKIEFAQNWMTLLSTEAVHDLHLGWRARAAEVSATLAMADERHDDAHRFLRRAGAEYQELGDQASAEVVQRDQKELESSSFTPKAIPEWSQALPVAPRIEIPGPGLEERKILDLLLKMARPHERLYDVGTVRFASLLAERPEHIAGPLFKAISKALPPQRNILRVHDLCWNPVNDELSALPWELCLYNPDAVTSLDRFTFYRPVENDTGRIRWLQVALNRVSSAGLDVDGVWGPATAAAWAAYRDSMSPANASDAQEIKAQLRKAASTARPSRRPLAVTLQPSSYVEKRGNRGLSIGGSDLAGIYETAGFDCMVMQGVDLEELSAEWGRKDPPDLIHIYASYLDAGSSGLLRPDMGSERAPRKRLRSSKPVRWRFGPSLMILDGPWQPNHREHARQILLRNAYAQSLAERGEFPNILATGLDRYPDLGRLEMLLGKIQQGKSLREIYGDIADSGIVKGGEALSGGLLHDGTGLMAPALWSCDPDLSIIY